MQRDDGQAVVMLEHVTTERAVVSRRDRDATWTALSRLPVTFWFAAPALARIRFQQRA